MRPPDPLPSSHSPTPPHPRPSPINAAITVRFFHPLRFVLRFIPLPGYYSHVPPTKDILNTLFYVIPICLSPSPSPLLNRPYAFQNTLVSWPLSTLVITWTKDLINIAAVFLAFDNNLSIVFIISITYVPSLFFPHG